MNTRSNAKSATPGEQGDVPKQVNGPQITLENGTEVDIRNTKSLRDLLEGDRTRPVVGAEEATSSILACAPRVWCLGCASK